MELKGKKIAFLGDSITEGAGVSDKSNIFWNILGQQTGAQVYGYGIGGTRIARQHKPSACARWDLDFISRVDSMIDDADIVVVFGGTNDFGHGDAPFGVMSDRTNDTFYGALHVLYQKLCQRYPSAQIVVMTPPPPQQRGRDRPERAGRPSGRKTGGLCGGHPASSGGLLHSCVGFVPCQRHPA